MKLVIAVSQALDLKCSAPLQRRVRISSAADCNHRYVQSMVLDVLISSTMLHSRHYPIVTGILRHHYVWPLGECEHGSFEFVETLYQEPPPLHEFCMSSLSGLRLQVSNTMCTIYNVPAACRGQCTVLLE